MSSDYHESPGFKVGIIVFVLSCGFPALELTGFGWGIDITLPVALGLSFVGGAIGGALMAPSSVVAGIVGGAVAGPLGLMAVYFYTSSRESVFHVELVIVQGIASLPGVGVGLIVNKLIGDDEPSHPMT